MDASTSMNGSCHSLSVKIPPFMMKNVRAWFLLCDAQFAIASITSSFTKSSHIIANLPADVVSRLTGWIFEQPDRSRIHYNDLQEKLLQIYDLSVIERARCLLDFPSSGLGDRNPSQLAEEMRMLSIKADGTRVDLLAELFLRTIPKSVRDQMANTEGLSVEDLGLKAEAIWRQTTASRPVSTSICSSEPQCLSDTVSSIKGEPFIPFKQKTSRDTKGKQFRSPQLNDRGFCYYHEKFGNNARACAPGCCFAKNGISGRR